MWELSRRAPNGKALLRFSPRNYLRSLPLDLLRQHLDSRSVTIGEDLDWSGPRTSLADAMTIALEAQEKGHALLRDAERIAALADDVGQAAIFAVGPQYFAKLDGLSSSLARSAWLFLNHPPEFRRAEDVRFTDANRKSKIWDGFKLPPNLNLVDDDAAIERLRSELKTRFRSRNVEFDIFERRRKTATGEEIDLVQLTVYREGPLEEQLEFEEGVLGRRPHRPVYEAAMTYEPTSGCLEVVVQHAEDRASFGSLCSEHLFAHPVGEKLPLRRFDLSGLMKPHAFPTAPSDRIEAVSVDLLRLMPMDTVSERLVLQKVGRQKKGNIWDMARLRFGENNPLDGGWLATQAKITIKFHREPGMGRGRTLPVTITMLHGCDLRERTERERLIAGKYMEQWGLLRSA